MGRPKKKTYEASQAFMDLTTELIRDYPSNKAYCEKYEYTHKGLLQKLALTEIYTVGAYEEPFIQYRAAEGREKEALEDYLDAKKKVYLLEHHINGMDDAQMQAVAVSLFLERKPQKSAQICVEGYMLSARTVCREKQRAIQYLAWCIEGYATWEAEALFENAI